MAIKNEFHKEFSLLPATGARARQLGELLYFTGKRCSKGHLSPRYASSSNCCQCIAERKNKASLNHRGRSSVRSEYDNKLALDAISRGDLTYQSIKKCPSGHNLRFVGSNNCVLCDAEKRKKRADSARWSRIKKEYGLTEKNVKFMLSEQGGLCSICNIDITAGYHIDHCHVKNKVRSLLCQKCNQAIGLLNENENIFFRAANYIRKHNET